VIKDFGSFDNLAKEVNAKTAAIQGSGWGWLVGDSEGAELSVGLQQGYQLPRGCHDA